ncbi:unnamed protein product [Prunus armeniaca]|uniref:Uncharacterized protein n=1 Tax=Prunus armeniaca TaxID=36596 RepID=A0A6J5Y129_PRUAR|nr:unnamed protein product [Prunus armeniaca]
MLLIIESSDEEHKWMRPKSLESPPIHNVKLIMKGESVALSAMAVSEWSKHKTTTNENVAFLSVYTSSL